MANTPANKVLISEAPVSSTCPTGMCYSATRRQAFKVDNIGGEVEGPIPGIISSSHPASIICRTTMGPKPN